MPCAPPATAVRPDVGGRPGAYGSVLDVVELSGVVVVVGEGMVVVVFSTVTGGMSRGGGTVVVPRGLDGVVGDDALVGGSDRGSATVTGVAAFASGRRVIVSPSTETAPVDPGVGVVSRVGLDPRCAWTSATVATMATSVRVMPARRRP